MRIWRLRRMLRLNKCPMGNSQLRLSGRPIYKCVICWSGMGVGGIEQRSGEIYKSISAIWGNPFSETQWSAWAGPALCLSDVPWECQMWGHPSTPGSDHHHPPPKRTVGCMVKTAPWVELTHHLRFLSTPCFHQRYMIKKQQQNGETFPERFILTSSESPPCPTVEL